MNFFTHRYKKMGHELSPEMIKKFKPPLSIRINTSKVSGDKGLSQKALLKRLGDKEVLLKKIPFLKDGYFVDADFSLASTTEYLMGYYYIQEAASQVVAEVLDPKPTDIVLDMCAAPGSKTTHLSQLMKNKGRIAALDSNLPRISSLNNNLERLGCENVTVYRKDAKFADDLLDIDDFEEGFDKILLDAPCSGNFAIEEDWFEKREPGDIEKMAAEQKKLLATAICILKDGGEMIYSTCSLEPEEDEQVIEYALEKFDVELVPIKVSFGQPGITEKTHLCKRFWPDTEGTQGFFIAKLRKLGD